MTEQEEKDVKETVERIKSYGIQCETFWAMRDNWGNLWIAPPSITDKFFINGNNFIPTNKAGERVLSLYATN